MKTVSTLKSRENLIKEIMHFGEIKTKSEAVDMALQMYVNWLKRQKLASLRGKVEWEGDLMKMRKGVL
jgi:Arc/MetJ family transcription regulator